MNVENGASGFFDRKTIECRSFEHADVKKQILSEQGDQEYAPSLDLHIFLRSVRLKSP